MSSLYQINQNYLQLVAEIEEAGGETNEEFDQALQITREQLAEKVANYKWVIDTILGDITVANREIQRLEDFKEAREKSIKTLSEKLLQALLLFGEEDAKGIKRLKCGTITLSTRKTPAAVQVEDESEVADSYKKVDITIQNLDVAVANSLIAALLKKDITCNNTVKLDKKKIGDDIKNGTTVEGASLVSKIKLSIT